MNILDRLISAWFEAVKTAVEKIIGFMDSIADAFGSLAMRLLTYRCQHDRTYYRWRRCDCYAPVQKPLKPVFLFYQIEEPVIAPSPVKPKPANDYVAICLAIQEMQQAMADSMKSGFSFLESIRHDENEPPPYPEFFINH